MKTGEADHATNTLLSHIRNGLSSDGESIEISIEQRQQHQDDEVQDVEQQHGHSIQERTPSCSKIAGHWGFCVKCIRAVILCLVLYTYISIAMAVFFVGLLFLGGPKLIHQSTYVASEEKRLMHSYRQKGLRINGRVERQWRVFESMSDDTSRWIEMAIVSYDGCDGAKYHMKLIPLNEKVKANIVQNDIPIIVLPGIPGSGIPEACVETLRWSVMARIAAFVIGCAFASYWVYMAYLFVSENSESNNLPLICIVSGVMSNLILTMCVFYAHKRSGHPVLTFSERVDGNDMLSFKGDDMGTYNPLAEVDKMLRKFARCSPCKQQTDKDQEQEGTSIPGRM